MNQHTALRPIPGPDPVELSHPSWWLWGIPVILISFLWFWWKRTPSVSQVRNKDLLNYALEQAEDNSLAPGLRYEQLHHALRAYLASVADPSWKSLSAAESFPAWQRLFHDNKVLAQTWHSRWEQAEGVVFGPDPVIENQVAQYVSYIREFESDLTPKDEK